MLTGVGKLSGCNALFLYKLPPFGDLPLSLCYGFKLQQRRLIWKLSQTHLAHGACRYEVLGTQGLVDMIQDFLQCATSLFLFLSSICPSQQFGNIGIGWV